MGFKKGSATNSALRGKKPQVEIAKRVALIAFKSKLWYYIVMGLWDVAKFFDSLNIPMLLARALRHDFPAIQLTLEMMVRNGK